MRLWSIVALLSLGVAASASGVTIEWVPIGNAGNPGDPQTTCNFCGPATTFGSVPHPYYISKYEVTNGQYAEFLNAVADTDTFDLYFAGPFFPGPNSVFQRISRSGGSGSYSYTVQAGYENAPVNFVSYFDAMRFANWLHNGQPSGAQDGSTTESGAYSLGGVLQPSNVMRNPGPVIALPSEDEWYKAAYYDASSMSYFDFPASSSSPTTCGAPSASPNRANCPAPGFPQDVTPVGSYPGSASPYGTFDQGGNVHEWNEFAMVIDGQDVRGVRGGSFANVPGDLAASARWFSVEHLQEENKGFRLVLIPEPGTGLLVIGGLLGLAAWRRSQ